MRKLLWIMLPVVALFALAGCTTDGAVYLSFDWDYWSYTPYNYYTTDPNLPPSAIYRGTDYLTEEGDYYFSYWVNTGTADHWWIHYTLTAKHGDPPWGTGEDSRFLLYLYDGWPGFVQLQGLTPAASTAAAGGGAGTQVIQGSPTPDDNPDGFVQKQLGQYTQTQGRYTLTVRTGLWVPKE
jgi:hypothetical protein